MEKRQHKSLDDIVFENKNKAYGAYYNRLTAGFDLMKSLFITVFGVGIMALVLSFTVKDAEVKEIEGDRYVPYTPTEIQPEKEDKKDEPIKEDKPAPKIKTIKSDKTDEIPTPKNDVEKQTEMTDNKDISKVIHGEEDIDGEENKGSKTPQPDGEDGGKGKGGDGDDGVEEPKKTEKAVYTVRDVTQMAVFPGCERFAGNKAKLQTCLSEQLQKELGTQLNDFNDVAQRQGINEAVAKVQFVIDKNGKIIQVKALNGGNVELSKESKDALERIAKRMVQKGKYIQPAKFEDGTPVNLAFTIPVKFIFN